MSEAPEKPTVKGYKWVERNSKSLKVGDVIYTDSTTPFVHFAKVYQVDSEVVRGIWGNRLKDVLTVNIQTAEAYQSCEPNRVGTGSFAKDSSDYQTWWVLVKVKVEDESPIKIKIIEV